MSQIETKLNTLENKVTRIENNLKGALPLAWKAITIIATLICIGIGFYVFHYTPKEIENYVIPVNGRMDVLTQRLDDAGKNPNTDNQISAVNKRVDDLTGRMASLEQAIQELKTALIANPRRAHDSIGQAIPKSRNEARVGYSVTRDLVEHAKQKGTVLRPQDFKELALPLLKQRYNDNELNKEAWMTVLTFASYKTVVNKIQYGVPRPQDNHPANYFEGGPQNLGDKEVWKDTVFVNCQIMINGAQANLALENVRFIDCDFKLEERTSAGERLFTALFTSPGPTVSATLLGHPIPKHTPGS